MNEKVDAEVYCTIMLTAAFIAPRVYKNSVRPDLSIEAIVERFKEGADAVLKMDARLPDEESLDKFPHMCGKNEPGLIR